MNKAKKARMIKEAINTGLLIIGMFAISTIFFLNYAIKTGAI